MKTLNTLVILLMLSSCGTKEGVAPPSPIVLTVPNAPTDLKSVLTPPVQIDLTWVDASNNEDGYKIERKSGTGAFSLIATLGQNVVTYSDKGLSTGTTYTYRVFSYNSKGNSNNSIETAVKTEDAEVASLKVGLVAYYPFRGNAEDSTGSLNHGTINGNVSITSDRFGIQNTAFMFEGGNIVIPHRQYLNINQAGEFSFSIWVNKTGNQNPVHILGKRGAGAQQFNWQLAQHITPGGAVGGGLVFSGVTGSNATGIDYNGITDATLTMNKWEHIVGVYNNGKWILYKNGVIAAQKTSNIFYTDASNPPLQIGNSGGWGAFYGKIDDIRIYNRELTPSEITYLFKN
jgi:hypothetical protein